MRKLGNLAKVIEYQIQAWKPSLNLAAIVFPRVQCICKREGDQLDWLVSKQSQGIQSLVIRILVMVQTKVQGICHDRNTMLHSNWNFENT